MPEQLLKISEVAETCAISPRTVRRLIDAGRLPAFRVGHQTRIRDVDLAAYIAANPRRPQAKP